MLEPYQPFRYSFCFFKDFTGVIQKRFPVLFFPAVFTLEVRKDELNIPAALEYICN
jgi:hypothetical protein